MTRLAKMRGFANFSPSGLYRWTLSREWEPTLERCMFLMLNPSTADADHFDPTVRRCFGYARRWGYGALDVGNLFAFRATDWRDMRRVGTGEDPVDMVGPCNDEALLEMAAGAGLIVCAWGSFAWAEERAEHVKQLLAHRDLHCLRLTKDGRPYHPLYQRDDLQPQLYRRRTHVQAGVQ